MIEPIFSTVIAAFIFAQVYQNFFEGRHTGATIAVLKAVATSLGL